MILLTKSANSYILEETMRTIGLPTLRLTVVNRHRKRRLTLTAVYPYQKFKIDVRIQYVVTNQKVSKIQNNNT